MNFDDTPEEAAFRATARAWIEANAPRELEAELKQGGFANNGLKSVDPIVASKAWQKKKAEAGWACLHWPKEYGGRGATPIERVIWGQEEGVYGALSGLATGSSTARRSGPAAPSIATTASSSPAPTRTCPSTRA